MNDAIGTALILGNNHAPNFAPLHNAERDAYCLGGTLWQCGFDLFGDGAHCGVTSSEMIGLVDRFVANCNTGPPRTIVTAFMGHGLEENDRLYLLGADSESTEDRLTTQYILEKLANIKNRGFAFLVVNACRKPGSAGAWEAMRMVIHPAKALMFAASCASGDLARDGTGDHSAPIERLREKLGAAAGTSLSEFLPSIFSDDTGHPTPEIIVSHNKGKRPAAVPAIRMERNMSVEKIITGAELRTWRDKSAMTSAVLAASISRMQSAVDFWENSAEPLPKNPKAALLAYYGEHGELKGVNDKENIVWDSFNDSPVAAEYESREQLRREFNTTCMRPDNAIDRLAYTDIDAAVKFYSKGTMWLASNEHLPGRMVGDRVLRRIIEDFHTKQSDSSFTDPDRMKGRRHMYQYEDEKTRKKFWVSAKAVEVSYWSRPSLELAPPQGQRRQGRYYPNRKWKVLTMSGASCAAPGQGGPARLSQLPCLGL